MLFSVLARPGFENHAFFQKYPGAFENLGAHLEFHIQEYSKTLVLTSRSTIKKAKMSSTSSTTTVSVAQPLPQPPTSSRSSSAAVRGSAVDHAAAAPLQSGESSEDERAIYDSDDEGPSSSDDWRLVDFDGKAYDPPPFGRDWVSKFCASGASMTSLKLRTNPLC